MRNERSLMVSIRAPFGGIAAQGNSKSESPGR